MEKEFKQVVFKYDDTLGFMVSIPAHLDIYSDDAMDLIRGTLKSHFLGSLKKYAVDLTNLNALQKLIHILETAVYIVLDLVKPIWISIFNKSKYDEIMAFIDAVVFKIREDKKAYEI